MAQLWLSQPTIYRGDSLRYGRVFAKWASLIAWTPTAALFEAIC